MKITKSKEEVDKFKENKKKANEGCYVCPGCGEDKDFHLTKKGKIKGIISSDRILVEGFFKQRYMKVDHYNCCTCGCEWESDPYEYK